MRCHQMLPDEWASDEARHGTSRNHRSTHFCSRALSGTKESRHPKETVELSKGNKVLTQSLLLFNPKLRATL
jgi:hypothetical protein